MADALDAVPDAPAVGLELGLTGAASADAAPQPGKQDAAPGQAREHVVELRQLHLETALPGAGPTGEDVEDELGAVHRLAPERFFAVALLGRRELVAEPQHAGLDLAGEPGPVLPLP